MYSGEPKVSVVVPFYNEEESISAMHAAVVAAVEPLGIPFEMVFVDDGSRDRTAEIATEIARADHRLRLVKFRRNYGQTPAMAAGIENARGEVIVTMNDGSVVSHRIAVNRGNPDQPLSNADIEEKFFDNCTLFHTRAQAVAVRDLILGIDQLADVRVLESALAGLPKKS